LVWALARRPDWLSLVPEKLYDPTWMEVLSLLGGVWDQRCWEEHRRCGPQSTEYVSWLLRENAHDLLCLPLLLAGRAAGEACRCLSEELSRRLAEKLADLYLRGPDFLDEDSLIASLTALSSHALKPLVAALKGKDEEWQVRDAAAEALGRLGQSGPEVVAALVAALEDKNRDVRVAAAEALGRISAKNREAVPLSNAPAVVRKEHEQLESQLLTIMKCVGAGADRRRNKPQETFDGKGRPG
jgi:HEAT repeats